MTCQYDYGILAHPTTSKKTILRKSYTGELGYEDTNASDRCLAKFMIPAKLSVPTAINAFRGKLIVGCAEGDLVHFDMKDAGLDKLADNQVDGGAGTIVKSKNVYPAGDEWHEGYVDDVYILGQHNGKAHPLDDCIGNVVSGGWILLMYPC